MQRDESAMKPPKEALAKPHLYVFLVYNNAKTQGNYSVGLFSVYTDSFHPRVIAQYFLPSQLAWSPSLIAGEVNTRNQSIGLPIFPQVAILLHQSNTHLSPRQLLCVTGRLVTIRWQLFNTADLNGIQVMTTLTILLIFSYMMFYLKPQLLQTNDHLRMSAFTS